MTIKDYIIKFTQENRRLPSQVELSKNLGLSPDVALEALMSFSRERKAGTTQEAPKPVKKKKKKSPVIPALRVALLIVSGFTFILSVYFTGLWFRGMFSFIIAGLISVSMVTYMVLSPQVARFSRGFVKVPLWLSFVIALVFSMGSTVAGQYNKLTSAQESATTSVNERAVYDLLIKEEAEKVAEIEDMKREKELHILTLEMLSDTEEKRLENWQSIATERHKIEDYNEAIQSAVIALQAIREQIKEELETGTNGATDDRKDFYHWIAGILNKPREVVEFWISVLPAVFIDIISALCLNLALYISESERPKRTRNRTQ